MKIITSLFAAIFISASLLAQPIADASYTDCNNDTESIYGVLGSGKVLVVANAGTNCSICQGHAPGVASLADNNQNTIRVWGSMTTKTGGTVNCSSINSWVSTYSWTNVFAFADSNKDWFNVATPQYTVISPFDSTIAYQGSNWNTAKSTAESLASTIGLDEDGLNAAVFNNGQSLRVEFDSPINSGTLTVYNLTGQQVAAFQLNGASNYSFNLQSVNSKGIYLVHIRANGRESIHKILL